MGPQLSSQILYCLSHAWTHARPVGAKCLVGLIRLAPLHKCEKVGKWIMVADAAYSSQALSYHLQRNPSQASL